MLPVLTWGTIDQEGLQRCENGFITFWIRWFRSCLFHRILTTFYMSVTSSCTISAASFSVTISTSPVSSSPAAPCWKTQYETDYITCVISINISVFVHLQYSKKWGSTKACSWDINVDQHITLHSFMHFKLWQLYFWVCQRNICIVAIVK